MKKSKLLPFRHFKRADHMTWKDDDVTSLPPAEGSPAAKQRRLLQFAWKAGDLISLPSNKKVLKEDASGKIAHPRPNYKEKPHTDFPEQPVGKLAEGDHHEDVQENHMRTLKSYKASSSGFVNGDLRDRDMHDEKGKIALTPRALDNVRAMDKVTDHPIPHDIHVFRGLDSHTEHQNLSVGSRFQDPGYTGTSRHHNVAFSYSSQGNGEEHISYIHVPAGSKGHYLDGHANRLDSEKEFVLHRGTHFEVTGHSHFTDPNFGTKFHVQHLKVVGSHPHEVYDATAD